MTLTEIEAQRDAALKALEEARQFQTMNHGDRSVTQQDLRQLSRDLDMWQRTLNKAQQASRGRQPGVAVAVFS